jgi:hypothetical protein
MITDEQQVPKNYTRRPRSPTDARTTFPQQRCASLTKGGGKNFEQPRMAVAQI